MSLKVIIFSSFENIQLHYTKVSEDSGFSVLTFSIASEENIYTTYKNAPDVVLLDLDIDGSDGIELCLRLKSEHLFNGFVALFSEQEEDYIQVEAFKAGADDYIFRPINSRVLIKRLRALINRKSENTALDKLKLLSHKGLKINRERYLVLKDNKEVILPRKEFEMLHLLLSEPQRVFSREEIYKDVWKKEENKNERIIDVHIRKIREKIGGGFIKTVKGVGYRMD